MSKPAAFWNDRFAKEEYVYGEAHNRFVASAARTWLPHPEEVLLLGAGEGRNAVHLAQEGHTVTAVDYAAKGLRKTERLSREAEVDVERIQADVREWDPVRTWDAVVVTFLHLPADERPGLYHLVQRCVRPGGCLVAEWFRPEQRTDGYTSGGPPDPAMMVTADELREYFAAAGIGHLEAAEPTLSEGMHQGPAATVRLVWRRPSSS